MAEIDRKTAIWANIQVHSALANSGEYNRSPHFLPENRAKVRALLEALCVKYFPGKKPGSLLDMGCGTGFIIDLAHDLFDSVHGVDVTEAMMSQVNLSPGNIELYKCEAESTPFEDGSYQMVTAYSFLDHLVRYEPVLEEAYRVLTPGGVFYSDLNPNRWFSVRMGTIEHLGLTDLPEVVGREVRSMLHNGEYYQETFGIDGETLKKAEPIKSFSSGIDPFEFTEAARSIGFSQVEFYPDWFLGQARVTQEQSGSAAHLVDNYLRSIFPASIDLFKYLRFVLVK